MTSDQLKAMKFQRPEMIPVNLGLLPATWMRYRDDLDALVRRHPAIFPGYTGKASYDELGSGTYHTGNHVDEWGCVWQNIHEGMEAIVTGHPVPTREMVHQLEEPSEVTPELKHGFMYLRLTDLRGFEEIMLDFAEDAPELQTLIDLVLRHNMKHLEMITRQMASDGLYWFGDDLGMQHGLAMGAAKWRQYMKPCFATIFARWRQAGGVAYFHTDGCIHEIIPDLIDCGVQIINPQIRANGLDNLVRVCKGKVCVHLDLDRQLFPFASPAEIDDHIRQCIAALGSREGGLWVGAECAPDVPLDNIEAICSAMEKYQTYWS